MTTITTLNTRELKPRIGTEILAGKEIRKVIVVPGKLVNIVVK